jgi:hypothetical protein
MIYNVVLYSTLGTGGGDNENFYYDWSQMEDVPYKVTFTFICPVLTLTNTAIGTIFVDLGQNSNKLAQGTTTNITYKASYLGSLFYTGTGANTYLYADTKTNGPTYLNGRPRNNNFLVEVHQNTANINANYAPAPAGYTLILNFEKC